MYYILLLLQYIHFALLGPDFCTTCLDQFYCCTIIFKSSHTIPHHTSACFLLDLHQILTVKHLQPHIRDHVLHPGPGHKPHLHPDQGPHVKMACPPKLNTINAQVFVDDIPVSIRESHGGSQLSITTDDFLKYISNFQIMTITAF